ncbi:DNA internalization-related competence protein ComEC/Rec2 [Orrella sp. JC864]|uniref:DNA internalization-related competence protein ComEC/Rec2 n=1 Tax=Orrella sp. JC864 TaxID=3120298 RepID=UPI00300A7B1A
MGLRLALAGFVAGCALVQTLGRLPAPGPWLAFAAGLAGVCCGVRARELRGAALLGMGVSLGLAWAAWQAQARLADALPEDDAGRVSRVLVQVASLPQGDDYESRFQARVLHARPAGVPARIQVSWFAPGAARLPQGRAPGAAGAPLPRIVPGQVWQMSLVMRRPAGLRNPSGFDYEAWVFQRGVRALGTVRGQPVLRADAPLESAAVAIERLRWHLRESMRQALGDARYGPVLIALALGDQAGVAQADWTTFNLTGITHLVSISGTHVTLVSAFCGLLALGAWKRLHWRGRAPAQHVPAQVAGACAALLAAGAYCLVAGWGIPARRTFFMLAVVALAAIGRVPMTPWRVLPAAAALVCLLDPWSPLAPGFWLSFGAVAVLMQAGARAASEPAAPSRAGRLAQRLRAAARLQWLITLALTPVLAYLFQQVPLVSPLANAMAIPVVGMLVTPLALLAALLLPLPGLAVPGAWAAWAGERLFAGMMVPLQWLADLDWASVPVAAAPWPYLALALAGIAWALREPGWPARPLGWVLALPVLLWSPARPAPGEWRITAVDVGQGAGVLVETATHVLLYDAGVRYGVDSDAAQRAIVPLLRARGIGALDVLAVSHADMDHAGGVRSVLQALPVRALHSSFDVGAYLRRETRLGQARDAPPRLPPVQRECLAGMSWTVDGVVFSYLHPAEPAAQRRDPDRNAQSCVLHVQGRHHSALLTGDIPVRQEEALVARGLGKVDWVLAAHHGAATSSGARLVQAVQAAHVVAQAGAGNRFGHPARAVELRWQRAGAVFWRTDRHGAVTAHSRAGGLAVSAERLARPRYWQGR